MHGADWFGLSRVQKGLVREAKGFWGEDHHLRGPRSFAKREGEHGAPTGALKGGSARSARGPTQHPADQHRGGLQGQAAPAALSRS